MSAAGRVLRRIGRAAGHDGGSGRSPAGTSASSAALPPADQRGGTLTAEQIRWFETFGFLRLRGVFADDIDRISVAFDEVFAEEPVYETREYIHFHEQRAIVHDIASRSASLEGLPTDPRCVGIVESLLGAKFEVKESDGSMFSCDTSWHADFYGAPMKVRNVKLSLYLEPLDAGNGAIRVLSGTNDWLGTYAKTIRSIVADPDLIEEQLGVRPDQLPGFVVESTPGDLVVWDYRTVHASFHGSERRRLLSLNYRES